jgi:hypothetical protein
MSLLSNKKFDCGTVPRDSATAGSANAAQVDRVNVAKGFRQTQKLQVVKSTQQSEISRPNFNQVFHASLSTFQPISVSIVQRPIFGEFSTGFRNFLNANNSKTAEASLLELWLLRGSPRRYEPAKSGLSRSNSKKINFRTFDPHSKPWGVGVADRITTGRWSSKRGSASSNLVTPDAEVDALAMNRRHLAVIYNVY